MSPRSNAVITDLFRDPGMEAGMTGPLRAPSIPLSWVTSFYISLPPRDIYFFDRRYIYTCI